MPESTPVNIEKIRSEAIRITWSDGHVSSYPSRFLRLECPCALCREEWSGRRLLDPKTVPSDIKIEKADLVGRYALAFSFSDAHGTGIYPFETLRALCFCSKCRKQEHHS